MLYYPVTNVMSATHWQPTEKRYEDDIMIGKIYPIVISPMDEEPCIYDDAGIDSTCYLWNEGNFLKEVETTVIKNNNIIRRNKYGFGFEGFSNGGK